MSTVAPPKKQHTQREWENLAKANARGEYRLVEPLDYLILEQLQDEGTLMGGYYPLATTVPALVKHFKKELTGNMFSTRLRVLHMQKLVIAVRTAGTKHGWQRTKQGKELVEAWRAKQ